MCTSRYTRVKQKGFKGFIAWSTTNTAMIIFLNMNTMVLLMKRCMYLRMKLTYSNIHNVKRTCMLISSNKSPPQYPCGGTWTLCASLSIQSNISVWIPGFWTWAFLYKLNVPSLGSRSKPLPLSWVCAFGLRAHMAKHSWMKLKTQIRVNLYFSHNLHHNLHHMLKTYGRSL